MIGRSNVKNSAILGGKELQVCPLSQSDRYLNNFSDVSDGIFPYSIITCSPDFRLATENRALPGTERS